LPAALATLLLKGARLVTETGGAFWLPCFLAAGGSQAAFLKSGRFYFAGLRFPTFAAGGARAPLVPAALRLRCLGRSSFASGFGDAAPQRRSPSHRNRGVVFTPLFPCSGRLPGGISEK
jgi:hypothetical protein